jgi:RNA polymerase sigma-70 factor, ECF subfamily
VEAFLRSGDEASFRLLYRSHTPALYRLALRFLGSRDRDAEEAVQKTWILAVEGLRAFRWESSLRTWLGGITLNACRELLRRRMRERQAAGGEPDSMAASARHRGGDEIDLERGIAALPEGCREVLILHDIEGYTHEEIAGLLHIESGTSKSQLSRARQLLRSRLGAIPGGSLKQSR